MSEQMIFPNTWEEFEQFYGFNDTEQIYTNGSRLIQTFRVKQWLEHLPSAERKGKWIIHPKGIYAHLVCSKCLSNAPYDCETNYCPNCGADMRDERAPLPDDDSIYG